LTTSAGPLSPNALLASLETIIPRPLVARKRPNLEARAAMHGRHGGAVVDVEPEELGQVEADDRRRLRGAQARPAEGFVVCRAKGEQVVGAGKVGEAVVGCRGVGDG
ncbi:hypothetical protein N0V85_009949, partial [Neurospora sp. IMI 360204]